MKKCCMVIYILYILLCYLKLKVGLSVLELETFILI